MKIKTNVILLMGFMYILCGCTKKEFEGPSIETLYGDFEIIDALKITNKTPSFSINEQVGFHCEFNKPRFFSYWYYYGHGPHCSIDVQDLDEKNYRTSL